MTPDQSSTAEAPTAVPRHPLLPTPDPARVALADIAGGQESEPPPKPARLRHDEFKGHRERLRQRFLAAGIQSLADHEKLELLLTFVLPRIDTKPIARALLSRFKSVGAVLSASPEALSDINGVGNTTAAFFGLVRDLNLHCLGEKLSRGTVVTHRREVDEYLRMRFGMRPDEYAVVLFLDNSNHIIADEIIGEGTVNQCVVYPRTIMEKALRLSAASIILCHNHPGGGVAASEEDWKITARIREVGKVMEIPLLDHVIITRERVISLREHVRWPK